jgi:DMSO/TMAO reductase YedYZ molybdopterin-dependent catalytic subunit
MFKSCYRRKTMLGSIPMGASVLLMLALHAYAPAVEIPSSVILRVDGEVTQPLALTLQDLAAMPHAKVAPTEHGVDTAYEGVPLTEILKKAGAPMGEQLRGKAMATYVLLSARDGYRVIFALPELDPAFSENCTEIILADTANGKPLPEKQGPVRVVVPKDKRAARWIRMVDSIQVVKAQ